MKKEFKFGLKDVKFLYYRYKDSSYFLLLIISIVIFSCVLLFFQLVVPQIEAWFSIRNEVERTNARIDTINGNINFMRNVDKTILEDQVELATNALPVEKNFGTIVNALSNSAINAGVTLDDFTFQVGKVASVEGQLNVFGQKTLSLVRVTVVISGSFDGINLFLDEIQNKLPLSEVTDVDGDILSTTVTIQFYQKKFPQIVYKDDVPLKGLSTTQVSLLEQLANWLPPPPAEELVGSESAESMPLF